MCGGATVLRDNYRNTVQILEVAQRVVSGDAFGDLDDLEEMKDRDVRCVRHGDRPCAWTPARPMLTTSRCWPRSNALPARSESG